MLTCRYCGSHRLETVGGDYGNPFDRRKEKTICLDCGRTVATEPDFQQTCFKVLSASKSK